MTDRGFTGLWLSAGRPLDFADGIPPTWTAILELELPAKKVKTYESQDPAPATRELLCRQRLLTPQGDHP